MLNQPFRSKRGPFEIVREERLTQTDQKIKKFSMPFTKKPVSNAALEATTQADTQFVILLDTPEVKKLQQNVLLDLTQ